MKYASVGGDKEVLDTLLFVRVAGNLVRDLVLWAKHKFSDPLRISLQHPIDLYFL